MIKINLDIHIRADREVVWAYMTDIPLSLAHNRLHREILPLDSSYARKGNKFIILHRTFWGTIKMNAVIQECNSMECIKIFETFPNPRENGFLHTCLFQIKPSTRGTQLMYTLEGSYGNPIRDFMVRPIVKGIMLEELFRIRHAIESSEPTLDIKAQRLKPV